MSHDVEQLEALLAATPVFKKLALQDRRTVAQHAVLKRYGKGETIFEQAAPSDSFYTVASGRVKSSRCCRAAGT